MDVKPRLTLVSEDSGAKTADLLRRCGQGDAKAFRDLYEIFSAKLYGVALRITRNPALASDAVHDAMLQVWRNADRYSLDRGSAEGWLVSLVRYRALDIIRKTGRETTGVDVPEQVDDDPDALSRLVSHGDAVALRACMETVDPPRRRLVILAFIEGLTQNEVAQRVGQPLGTVKSSIRRALIALRACLDGAGKPPSPAGDAPS
jgi:RNA polymerase sigma-70 factor (ECF subfamily)